jgi:hypothetical protein
MALLFSGFQSGKAAAAPGAAWLRRFSLGLRQTQAARLGVVQLKQQVAFFTYCPSRKWRWRSRLPCGAQLNGVDGFDAPGIWRSAAWRFAHGGDAHRNGGGECGCRVQAGM